MPQRITGRLENLVELMRKPHPSPAEDDAAARRASQPGRATALPLPHERDESSAAGHSPDGVIRRAQLDQTSGKVDTDNYTRVRDVSRDRRLPRPNGEQ
jgi:hypothetical protein